VQEAQQPDAQEQDAEAPDKVLLVDDNPTNLQVLFQTLKGEGYKLLIAKSGEQALGVAKKTRPAMILLDIMMPGIDGFEACKRLKADPDTADAAVIFLSALTETSDKVRGLELGAVDYISKPFDPDEVIARVATHLKIRRLERRLSQQNQELEAINRRMKLDLEAAARVQRALLPTEPPANERAAFAWTYRPCEDLGGDSMNVFAFDDRFIGVYVLDVCGHGVSSSLLAVSVSRHLNVTDEHSSLLVEASEESGGRVITSPAEVARRLNRLYPMDSRSRLYFTFLYGILDTADGSFRFVSAGNQGPTVIRADGQIEIHDVPAVPVGLLPDSDYEDALIQLGAGDCLYLHSDGLSEERSEDGEEFGRDRMSGVLAEHKAEGMDKALEALVEAVVAWRGDEHLRDDVVLLGVECKSRAA
jgi:sigma-B regulation protein RsbU (phosphoserine phosphatase)